MPDEGEPHARTWMAMAREDIWGADLIDEVWDNLAAVASVIVRHEPVTMLVHPDDVDDAREVLHPAVQILEQPLDDLWIRDTGPVFVHGTDGAQAGVDFNFNGWGGKQQHADDALVAAAVLADARVRRLTTDLVIEGGAIESTARAARSSPAAACSTTTATPAGAPRTSRGSSAVCSASER